MFNIYLFSQCLTVPGRWLVSVKKFLLWLKWHLSLLFGRKTRWTTSTTCFWRRKETLFTNMHLGQIFRKGPYFIRTHYPMGWPVENSSSTTGACITSRWVWEMSYLWYDIPSLSDQISLRQIGCVAVTSLSVYNRDSMEESCNATRSSISLRSLHAHAVWMFLRKCATCGRKLWDSSPWFRFLHSIPGSPRLE